MSTPDSIAESRRRSIGARRSPLTQEAILDAAQRLIEEGVAGFSIEAVARKARAGKPTIYRWWPNKAALLLDVYRRQREMQLYFDTGSVERDLALFLFRQLTHWRDTGAGAIFRFILAQAQSDVAAAEALATYSAEQRQKTGEIFSRGIERGELAKEIDVALAAEAMTAFAWQRLLTQNLETDPAQLQALAHQMVRGLAAPRP